MVKFVGFFLGAGDRLWPLLESLRSEPPARDPSSNFPVSPSHPNRVWEQSHLNLEV